MSVLKNGFGINKRGFLLNTILFAAFFTFFFEFYLHVIPKAVASPSDTTLTQIIFTITIAVTLLIASFQKNRLLKRNILFASALITAIFTLLIAVSPPAFTYIEVIVVAIFFSIGQLSFYVHFWNSTKSEGRGRVGGLIGLLSLPIYFIVDSIAASGISLIEAIIIAASLSLIPIVALTLRPKREISTTQKEGTYPEKRTILLYAIPWILFSLINATFSKNIALTTVAQLPSDFYVNLAIAQTVAALFGALIGGTIADFFGRRLTLIMSVTLSGISIVLYGLLQSQSLYLAFIADGLSWGILLTLYSFVIWGDLSNKENCAKMYAIGLITYYMTLVIGLLPTGISHLSFLESALAGCLIIFFSNLPIGLAPELQSPDFREKIMLKMHIKAVKKAAKEFENQT